MIESVSLASSAGRFSPHTILSPLGMATIAVFSDDTYLWRRAMFMLEERIPAYVYNHADGDAPAPVQRRKGKKTSW